ncbi:MAG TPA: hypothetical protein VFS20_24735 [Longimicrobium sp.]|nr:hypothetical protein [Longimicrobium sp.]
MSDTERHHPEIEAAGGLAELLRRELSTYAGGTEGLEVSTPGSLHWAYVVVGDRSAQATSGGEIYVTSFWESHVHLAHQKARKFTSLAAALSAWLIDRMPASELARRMPYVALEEGALAYEAGPAAYIAHRWAALRRQFAEGAAGSGAWEATLLPVVEVAAADPLVGRMHPYISITRLGVWRGLGPDDDLLPVIDPVRGAPGRFTLCTYPGTPLAEGTAREMVALLAEHVRAADKPR